MDHAIGLLSAKDPFLIDSGLQRLKLLLASDAEAQKVVQRGAHKKLVAMVEEETRQGVWC